ncbi:MAG: YdcF family protein [Cytophagaceae bacterium]|jgi:uncharacterized SAM-binding protein YcdF (DUF218 family)|nr:YdcF family protein [Cytophagaceae bacterium]
MLENKNAPVLLVTSPEHMFRAIRTFEKAGCKQVSGEAAFAEVIDPQALEKELPESSGKTIWRYNLWNYWIYEIIVLREYAAIVYYYCKGWI